MNDRGDRRTWGGVLAVWQLDIESGFLYWNEHIKTDSDRDTQQRKNKLYNWIEKKYLNADWWHSNEYTNSVDCINSL